MSVFALTVDSVQQRLKDDGVSTLVGAKDWCIALSNSAYQDGVTGTVFLQPAMRIPGNWLSQNTGVYAKLPPTDFTLTPSTSDPNWIYPVVNADGAQWYKYLDNSSGARGISTYSVAANQALVFETSQQNQTPNSDVLGDVGWGASGDYMSGVSLRFYRDNSADVYKEGEWLGHFTCSGQVSPYGQSYGQISYHSSNAYVGFMIIPCRERELLVISTLGGGFSIIFEDIPEGTTDPIITPSAPIWFYAASGVDSTMRLALLQYATSESGTGNMIGNLSYFSRDPGASPAGGFQTYIDGFVDSTITTVPALQVSDGANPANPYVNNSNGVVLNVTLTAGSQTSGPYTVNTTPFIFGARGYTLPQIGNTVGPPLDVTDYVLEMSYESSDSIAGTRMPVTLVDPKAIEAAGIALSSGNQPGHLITQITDRPWQCFDSDGTQIIEALNEPPKFQEGIIFDDDGNPTYGDDSNQNETVQVTLRDGYKQAEDYIFIEVIPLDGLSVAEAYTLITDTIGLTASAIGRMPNLSTDLTTTYISQAGNPTETYNLQIQPGDRGSDWMDRIAKTYCANYFHGLYPAVMGGVGWNQPQLLAEADLPSTPTVTLYDSIEAAMETGGYSRSDAPYYVFRKVDVQMLCPEANDIYVNGLDFRTRRPILFHQSDETSMDPTVSPVARTPAWRGQRCGYTWIDPTLGDLSACEYAMSLLFPRLTIARSLVEIQTDFWASLRRGTLVELVFAEGGGIKSASTGEITNPAICRIKTISAKFIQLGNDGVLQPWRPTNYVCQLGTEASNLNTQHTSLQGIKAEWENLRLKTKGTQWGDATKKEIWNRPLILQDEAS